MGLQRCCGPWDRSLALAGRCENLLRASVRSDIRVLRSACDAGLCAILMYIRICEAGAAGYGWFGPCGGRPEVLTQYVSHADTEAGAVQVFLHAKEGLSMQDAVYPDGKEVEHPACVAPELDRGETGASVCNGGDVSLSVFTCKRKAKGMSYCRHSSSLWPSVRRLWRLT